MPCYTSKTIIIFAFCKGIGLRFKSREICPVLIKDLLALAGFVFVFLQTAFVLNLVLQSRQRSLVFLLLF